MDLKNNRITVGELLANPQAKELFYREFPALVNSPYLKNASRMPFSDVVRLANRYLAPEKIRQIMKELEQI